MHLQPKDLLSACSVDTYTKSLCNNDFWKNKIRLEFPRHATKEHKSYKRAYNILHLKKFPPLTLTEKFIKKMMDKGAGKDGFSNVVVNGNGENVLARKSLLKDLKKIGLRNVKIGSFYITFETNNPREFYTALKFLARRDHNRLHLQNLRDYLRWDGDLLTFTFDY